VPTQQLDRTLQPIDRDEEGVDIYPAALRGHLEFPRFALSDGNRLFVADGGNDRILIYDQLPTANGAPADHIIGQVNDQVNNVSDSAFSGRRRQRGALSAPSSLAWDGGNLRERPVQSSAPWSSLWPRGGRNTGVRNGASFDVYAVAVASPLR
jgi:hypothetical protein